VDTTDFTNYLRKLPIGGGTAPEAVDQRALCIHSRRFGRFHRHETDLHPPVKSSGYSRSHGKKIAIVVGLLNVFDHRRGGVDERGELFVRETGRVTQVTDLTGNRGLCQLLVKRCDTRAGSSLM